MHGVLEPQAFSRCRARAHEHGKHAQRGENPPNQPDLRWFWAMFEACDSDSALACSGSSPCSARSAACSSSRTECTCEVEFSGERRTVACGERACVGGTSVVCADQNVSVQRGTCTAPPASSGGDMTPGGPTNPGIDPSCGDLSTFCETSCGTPASVSSDCEATASAGDPAACAEWPPRERRALHPLTLAFQASWTGHGRAN